MKTLTDIDWARWSPTDRATLIFVIDAPPKAGGAPRSGIADVEPTRILLIEKKRGLGAGKVNGPGGRLEPGEAPIDCALRELREELGVTGLGARERGVLRFQFVDGYALHCHVFRADACEGEPVETDEAVPLWTPLDAIPYARMWADDALWLPLVLAERSFHGRFLFDGDRMLDHELEELTPPA